MALRREELLRVYIFVQIVLLVQRLSQYLSHKYDINCSIHKSGGNYRINILAKSLDKVKILILPFMHKTISPATHCERRRNDL